MFPETKTFQRVLYQLCKRSASEEMKPGYLDMVPQPISPLSVVVFEVCEFTELKVHQGVLGVAKQNLLPS